MVESTGFENRQGRKPLVSSNLTLSAKGADDRKKGSPPFSRILLVSPNLVLQRDDPFTTGIVFMPFGLAHLAGHLRSLQYECTVLDAFGLDPLSFWEEGSFVFRGLTPEQTLANARGDFSAIFVYAANLTWHRSTLAHIRAMRLKFPETPIIVCEHTQAVTAYSLEPVQQEFFSTGASHLITGEPEIRAQRLLEFLMNGGASQSLPTDGVHHYRDGTVHGMPALEKIADLDRLSFPAWDLFPLQNYWNLRYAHGPLSASRYLPLLTSRGCPYACRFCVIPATNNLKWRARSARHVVDEMEHWLNKLGVREFHIEDVDPTVSDRRTRDICQEILKRKLKIKWKISSGTKVETLKDAETIRLMAMAGCSYISISPESGSPRVMKLIGKPFKYDHAVHLIKTMNRYGIYSQACFVLGFPGEEDEDRVLTQKMVRDLTRAGVSEIAQFIVTPVPGSEIEAQFRGYSDLSQLNFSPTWREDYAKLNAFRISLYRKFLLWKLLYHPLAILVQPLRFLLRRFETKMEMAPFRALHVTGLLKGFWGRRLHPEQTERGTHGFHPNTA